MAPHNKETTSGGVVLAAMFIAGFIILYPFCGTFAVPFVAHELGGMPDHKASFSTSQDRRPWWHVWNDYPNPTRDALLGLFGIAVIVTVFWFFTAR